MLLKDITRGTDRKQHQELEPRECRLPDHAANAAPRQAHLKWTQRFPARDKLDFMSLQQPLKSSKIWLPHRLIFYLPETRPDSTGGGEHRVKLTCNATSLKRYFIITRSQPISRSDKMPRVIRRWSCVKPWANYSTLSAGPVLRTFMKYSIAFCSLQEAVINVTSGLFVRMIVPGKTVKFRDRGLNCCRDIRPKSSETTFSTTFSRQLPTWSMAVNQVGIDVCVNLVILG